MKIVKKKNLIFEYKKNIYVVVCGSYRGKDIYEKKRQMSLFRFVPPIGSRVFLKFYY